MINDDFDPEILSQSLKYKKNAFGGALLNPSFEETKVSIRPNKLVGLAKFKADPLIPGGFIAHPVTIKAMRKDIFFAAVSGEVGFQDLETLHQCRSCQTELDLQFWYFCPYCESSFI